VSGAGNQQVGFVIECHKMLVDLYSEVTVNEAKKLSCANAVFCFHRPQGKHKQKEKVQGKGKC